MVKLIFHAVNLAPHVIKAALIVLDFLPKNAVLNWINVGSVSFLCLRPIQGLCRVSASAGTSCPHFH